MVRQAQAGDMDRICEIFAAARQYMARSGNPTQWGDSYPPRTMLEEDLARGQLYVCCDKTDRPYGVFVFFLGEDPSYTQLRGGHWLNDRPYGTIHRIAGDGTAKGVFSECLDFCRGMSRDIRADTHPNNKTMQHVLAKHGFVYCGTVELAGQREDALRLAYQYEG